MFSKGKELSGKKTLIHAHRAYRMAIQILQHKLGGGAAGSAAAAATGGSGGGTVTTATSASDAINFGVCNAEKLAMEHSTDASDNVWENFSKPYRMAFDALDKQLLALSKQHHK